jgi:hypothetical protein
MGHKAAVLVRKPFSFEVRPMALLAVLSFLGMRNQSAIENRSLIRVDITTSGKHALRRDAESMEL